ncbi:hypothetical protein [Hymenobacter negativus]|uniref:DUF3806 domain-containing protein n=1 Tax=Hymenobacter negativus TaxID=2795026 RepID=A0ABS0Q595_9BACT|nr:MULTISPECIES: hypothetical protein [Bacteria]MBH8557426.1 hypothetical protein [Hymenobacter negativus]MBH8568041.1 hypothetical protein [Hymenobacter negativus]MBR7207777.1 hypothetical protein [Microvirga sp. STS02]
MSEPTPTPLDSINAAAEQVRQQLKLKAFDAESVAHLDNFIQAQRGTLGAAERPGVVLALGCFLGQCLVEVYRGEWGTGKDGTTGVGLAGRFFFNPFYLVDAQLNEGESASVAAFFASVPQRLKTPPAARKAWIS